jgi:tagatose-1,6-bisphosphate aldolase non-catalytic subunit AgaZ/GatZ
LETVEDALAGLARIQTNMDLSRKAITCMSTDPRVAERALALLEATALDTTARCQQIQQQVIVATEYPYGREPEKVAA